MEWIFVQQDLFKLVIAIFVGSAIGWEREYRNKSAGFRTITMICFASCLFTLLSKYIGAGSPDRIAANVVTGIGFLGAGAIFKDDTQVSGLTTAATIWASAALGMCIGSGKMALAFCALACILSILVVFNRLEVLIDNANESRIYRITCRYNEQTLVKYENMFKQYGLKAEKSKFVRKNDLFTGTWRVIGKHPGHEAFVKNTIENSDIVDFEF